MKFTERRTYVSVLLLVQFGLTIVNAQQPCTSFDGKAGSCMLLRSCNSLYTLIRKTPLLPEDRSVLSRSQCGWSTAENHPLVCCTDSSDRPSNRSLLPAQGVCGIQTADRIVGGVDARIDEFPWLALLKYAKPNNVFGFHCGGVLINDRYVLTASHCVNGRDIPTTWNLAEVRLGEWDTSTTVDCEGLGVDADCSPDPIDIPIERKIPHPSYNPQSREQYNDIALLRLEQPVAYTDFIKPICLPNTAELRTKSTVGLKLHVAGWGRTATERFSNVKQKVRVDGVDLTSCNEVYKEERVTLLDGQLCAGGETGKDSCQGDSGGPLMGNAVNQNIQYWYLVGLVSFGPTPCGQQGWPGVYTSVAKYTDWIESNLLE
ncbi:serine protease easter-like [Toxorhynchites rutilus septentrionalis]|uniref:serine protease easter-like n=1 Tax=Toxorhynchites rutilus septentrionalis TaxID=329112 RepID=UPI002479BD19|nr:serine protease easter-like [Toxorhynchites rutilus septentrionalis]